jgi:DNA-binding NarL/FixJ family response regulator
VTVADRGPHRGVVEPALTYHGLVATRVASPDFIGRKRELDALVEAIARGRARDAVVVLVGGDAGIGKTRLVAEAAARAREQGALVLEGGCVSLGSGEGLPFGPIVEALRRLPELIATGRVGTLRSIDELRSVETNDLGRLMPELGSATSSDAGMFERPDWVQARIFESILALLRRLGDEVPVALIVEDLHWSDSATRDLLSFLARNARDECLVIIGTYRTDDLHRRHPLRPWLAEMERLPRVIRTEVGRFERTELAAQVAAILGHQPPDDLVEAIAHRAEGNPFFVEELLASGAEGGVDRIPPTLRDVLLTRVTTLSEEGQRILGVAAVAGRTAQPGLLAAVAGAADEAEIEAPLREALAAQILIDDPSMPGDAYRFRHALMAEAVYDDLLPTERRRLHAAYAASIDALPVPSGAEGASQLAALAHHSTAAHDQVRALQAWVRSGRAAAAAHLFGEAGPAFERAIELWDAVPPDDRPTDTDVASLYFEAALSAMAGGRTERAIDLARAAIEGLDQTRQRERWAAANERLARAIWRAGRMEEGLAILQSTAAALERSGPTPVRARIMAAIASAHMLRSDHPFAIAAASEAIDVARATGARAAEAHARNTLGVSTALIGRCAEGIAMLREAVVVTHELMDVDDMGRAYANLSSVLTICGSNEESLAVALEGVAWARGVGAFGGYGRFIGGNAINAAVELGRWDQAEALAHDLFADETVGVNRIGMINTVGPFLARRGRTDEAEPMLREGRALIDPLREAQFTGPIFVGLAELALVSGRPDEAAAAVADGARRLDRTADHYYHSELLAMGARAEADRAEFARAGRDAAEASSAATTAKSYRDILSEWLAEAAEPDIFGGQLAADAAIAGAEAGRAAGTSTADAWRAAVAAADRTDSAWRKAYARYRLAEALLLGRAPRREAATALGDAWARANALSAAPLRGWIEALARRSRVEIPDAAAEEDQPPMESTDAPADDHGLTAREREVLALLVEGHTNRRIAEELFISESTAGVHVSNILGKLGVASRTEAATVAARLGLVD